MVSLEAVFLLVLAYLLGSVPTGFLVGYLYGVDVRRAGSGNVGAANVARLVGKTQGLLTLLLDAAKGFIPVVLSVQLGLSALLTCLVALGAFVGHLYPVFLGFKGGKGVATALGIFLGLAPAGTVLLLVVFLLVAVASRVVSLASVVAAATAPIAFWLFSYPAPLVGLSLVLGLWIIVRHRDNIQRLLRGAEPKFNL